jgi:hypothetical protein
MELFLESEPSIVDRTFGALYADGVFLAHTLEDVVRELDGIPVDEWKVQDKTAIPHGRYRVIITRSGRFSRKAGHDVYLPELLSVPGFDKIRIHGGNGPEDTDGCILRRRPARGEQRDIQLPARDRAREAEDSGSRSSRTTRFGSRWNERKLPSSGKERT